MTSTSDRPRQPLSRKRRLAFSVILLLVPSALLFLIGEVYMRVARPTIDLDVVTGREPGRNAMEDWAFLDAFSAYRGRPGAYGEEGKTISGQGFISTPEIAVEKPDDTIRVVFLGGSSTAGTGIVLADEDTWPSRVAEGLRQTLNGKKLEFINAALGGYTTFESFGRLWSRIRFYSPDIIVVYHGWNEMYYFGRGNKIVTWKTLPDGSWGFSRAPKIETYKPYWIDPLLKYSQLLTKLRLMLSKPNNGERGGAKEVKDHYDESGLEIFRTNLRLLRNAAREFKAELFVAKQATLIVPGLADEDRKRCRYHFHGFDHDAHVHAFDRLYEIIDQEIDADHVIDVAQLSGTSDYFYDHIHPTEEGAREIAKLVVHALRPTIERRTTRGAKP